MSNKEISKKIFRGLRARGQRAYRLHFGTSLALKYLNQVLRECRKIASILYKFKNMSQEMWSKPIKPVLNSHTFRP